MITTQKLHRNKKEKEGLAAEAICYVKSSNLMDQREKGSENDQTNKQTNIQRWNVWFVL